MISKSKHNLKIRARETQKTNTEEQRISFLK